MRARIASLLMALLLLGAAPGALAPAVARADGDPASDVLLGENVFYPYSPAVSQALQNTLNAATAAAAKAHFPVKVALIASPIDLGVIPSLFGQPQKYASFLDQEISFQGRQLLLVVMPAGFGTAGLPRAAQAEVASLTKPSGSSSNALASAAITAVSKLSAAAGHPFSAAPGSSRGSGGSSTILVVALALAALATAAALATVTMRRRGEAAARGAPDR